MTLRELLSNAIDGAVPADAVDWASGEDRPRRLAYNGTPLWPDIGVPAKAILAEKARAAVDAARQVKEGRELLEILARSGAVDG